MPPFPPGGQAFADKGFSGTNAIDQHKPKLAAEPVMVAAAKLTQADRCAVDQLKKPRLGSKAQLEFLRTFRFRDLRCIDVDKTDINARHIMSSRNSRSKTAAI